MPPAAARSRRPVKVRILLGVAVLAVTGAVFAAAADADGGPDHRLATATMRSTEQVLDEVGVIEPVQQASVSFPAGGTVATVEVAVGDQVAVGDVLATLDPTSLERALHTAEATLAQAELRLERALAGEDVGSIGGAPAGTGVALSVDGEDAEIQLVGATAPDPELRAAREAVVAAQRQVDEALAAADEALADAEVLCTWADDEAEPEPDPVPDPADEAAGIAACRDALDAVLTAQQAAAASQQALAEAATALDELLADRLADLDAPTTSAPAPSGTGAAPSAPSTGPTGGATASSPSSADLIAYQAAVGAAEAAVAVADQAITQATIVSPIDGTVVSVGVEPGDEVAAASADQAVVVAGDEGYEVTTTVSVTELPDLEVGQEVSVTPDGRDVQLDGEIVAIGVAASDGGTGYPVTIALVDAPDGSLRNGAIAAVTITTASADDTLVVPTSAVTVDGTSATVSVADGTAAEEVAVEVGAMGPTWTEIRRGLDAGQQVVLADLDEPLPGSATTSNDTGGGGFQGGPPAGLFGPP